MGPLEITSGFSLTNGRVCLAASDFAYGNRSDLNTPLAHAAILDCQNARVIAFRGSASIRDWITDFECARNSKGVHHGFGDAMESVRPALMAAAGWIKPPVFVTGHSLGGAMAVLAAKALADADFPVQGVYTFGGPRTGNRAWAQGYDLMLGSRTFRFINEEDIVPRVPSWVMGYSHVGTECFLPTIGPMRFNPPLWFKIVSDVIGTFLDWKRGRIAQLSDHVASAYMERLNQGGAAGVADAVLEVQKMTRGF